MHTSLHFQKILEKKSNFDLLAQLNINKKSFVNTQFQSLHFIPSYFDSNQTVFLNNSLRNKYKKIISKISGENIICTILIGDSGIICSHSAFNLYPDPLEINLLILYFNQLIQD